MQLRFLGFWVSGFCVALVWATSAAAVPSMLVDKGSSVIIDPENDTEPAHLSDWFVDGEGHLYEGTWFYRVGPSGPEIDVANLTLLSATASNQDADPGNETLDVSYRLAGAFDLDITYVLEGSNSGLSVLEETVTVTDLRTSGGAQTVHLFEYTDLDLFTTDDDASASLLATGHIQQDDEASISFGEDEVVSGVLPSSWEIDEYPEQRIRFEDAFASNLSSSDLTAGGILDYTFTFQWNLALNPGQSMGFVKEKRINILPEPATSVALLAGGLLLFGLRARRDSRRRG